MLERTRKQKLNCRPVFKLIELFDKTSAASIRRSCEDWIPMSALKTMIRISCDHVYRRTYEMNSKRRKKIKTSGRNTYKNIYDTVHVNVRAYRGNKSTKRTSGSIRSVSLRRLAFSVLRSLSIFRSIFPWRAYSHSLFLIFFLAFRGAGISALAVLAKSYRGRIFLGENNPIWSKIALPNENQLNSKSLPAFPQSLCFSLVTAMTSNLSHQKPKRLISMWMKWMFRSFWIQKGYFRRRTGGFIYWTLLIKILGCSTQSGLQNV